MKSIIRASLVLICFSLITNPASYAAGRKTSMHDLKAHSKSHAKSAPTRVNDIKKKRGKKVKVQSTPHRKSNWFSKGNSSSKSPQTGTRTK